jgi:hypothetical protein
MTDGPDRWGLVANVISDRVLRTGAKVWVQWVNGDAACPRVHGVGKGGRKVTKYTHYKRLHNFRAAWIPPHIRDMVILQWGQRAEAEGVAADLTRMWAGIRFFHRDGRLLADGAPESQAFERWRR